MKIRFVNRKKKQYPHGIQLLDMTEELRKAGISALSTVETGRFDQPELKVKFKKKVTDGAERTIRNGIVRVKYQPFNKPYRAKGVDGWLFFIGLKKALSDLHVMGTSCWSNGRNSELALRVGLAKPDARGGRVFPTDADDPEVTKEVEPIKTNRRVSRIGGGFGTFETNKKVERAAISFVTKHYKSQGWNVQSVEFDKRGFDLLCVKDAIEKHIEVKGIQGDTESFNITAGEVQCAKGDKNFVICVVTSAIAKQPQLSQYKAQEFIRKFVLAPIAYRASLRI